MSEKRIVYSTDPKDFVEDRKGRTEKAPSNQPFQLSQLMIIFRLEKNGRGGKTVTVMSGWPRNEEVVKQMTKDLKSSCGVGGTYHLLDSGAEIEIQGDKRDQLKKILMQKGIKYKGM